MGSNPTPGAKKTFYTLSDNHHINMFMEVVLSIILFITGLAVIKLYIETVKDRLIAYDVFKTIKTPVVDLGGIPIFIIVSLSSLIFYLFGYLSPRLFFAIILTSSLASIIGFIDDIKKTLPGWYKPVSAMLIGIPIIVLRLYSPKLKFFDGIIFNLPIIYLLLILIGFSVASNAVNMLDVVNGSAAIGVAFVMILNIIVTYLQGGDYIVSLIFLITILSFLFFNRYPSKIFLGNIGSMLLGSMVAFTAIYNRTEFLTVIAMYPFIVNGLFYLDKFKRFVERRVHGYKIASLNEEGLIEDQCEEGAPIVLLKYLVSTGPKSEPHVVMEMTVLFLYSTLLSLIIFFLLW